MQRGSTHCFKLKVQSTNGMNDTFNVEGQYLDCEQGFVFVLADTIEEAAHQVPNAVLVSRVGFAVRPPPSLSEQDR